MQPFLLKHLCRQQSWQSKHATGLLLTWLEWSSKCGLEAVVHKCIAKVVTHNIPVSTALLGAMQPKHAAALLEALHAEIARLRAR